MASLAIFIAMMVLFAVAKTQTVDISCEFLFHNEIYTCRLADITISDSADADYVISGVHETDMTNEDVMKVQIINSNIPFVITQLFTTFPALNACYITNGGLTRIQSNAFPNASSLTYLEVQQNHELRIIQENAFVGAPNLFNIDLYDNEIEEIHENAFEGLGLLLQLFLDRNHLSHLPLNVFRPLTTLYTLQLSENHFESLEGKLFIHNSEIRILEVALNQINAISESLLDNLPQLSFFNTLGNICISRMFFISETTPVSYVREALTSCFNNFVEVRRIILEVRGPITLRYENGTEIIRI